LTTEDDDEYEKGMITKILPMDAALDSYPSPGKERVIKDSRVKSMRVDIGVDHPD
jgi:hypothetical protein